MKHPYNNSTKKLISLVPAVVFTGPFTRFISTSPSVSVALRQELTHKGYFAAFVRLSSALCALLVSCIIILGASRLDSSSAI